LIPRRIRVCFYCSRPLVHGSCFPDNGPFPDNLATRDHIYPRWFVRQQSWQPDEAWCQLNSVPSCLACNNAKGGALPVEWIEHLAAAGQRRLADRLHLLALARAAEDRRVGRPPRLPCRPW
jgi:hypothetical protein